MSKLPLDPPGPYENAVCPECGDEAFFVEGETSDGPFAFSCDSCEYIIDSSEAPVELLELARKVGMRTPTPEGKP